MIKINVTHYTHKNQNYFVRKKSKNDTSVKAFNEICTCEVKYVAYGTQHTQCSVRYVACPMLMFKLIAIDCTAMIGEKRKLGRIFEIKSCDRISSSVIFFVSVFSAFDVGWLYTF